MEKQKEYLIKYVNYLEKNGINITSDDMEAFNYVENDPELKNVASNIKSAGSKESRLNIVEKYIQEKEFEKKTEEEKLKAALEKKFGVDLTNIDHMKLQSGIDIIAFYDTKLGRKIRAWYECSYWEYFKYYILNKTFWVYKVYYPIMIHVFGKHYDWQDYKNYE